jgi:hypothetical protein
MAGDTSPREPQRPQREHEVTKQHTWTQVTAGLTKLVGIGIGINEARRQNSNEILIMFAALCVLGVDAMETILLRLIDRLFGSDSTR